ncbi:hypothetical protein OG792_15285 [Micromonospora sp. NBC_01699]|uniref:hypothetical protein n=1 Tax=Micromonospora sp. NBC_01699 TaxID=2975984 RepID=UPI002E2FA494|nr:hypothetical protein [Micromonospora sp. NBC_01699]
MADTDDFGYDDVALDAEFAAFRTGLLGRVVPPGPDVVRRTVRHRRRVATTTGVALALVLVIGPVAAVASLNNPPNPSPSPGTTAGPSPSETVGPTPGESTAPTTPTVPDGRISRAELLGARLDLPAWRAGPGCPDRGARLTGEPGGDRDNVLVATAYGDIDDDGATETVALVRCLVNQGGPAQVVAFDRDESGRIVTVGQVVRTDPSTPQWLLDVEVRADGVVRVEVADLAPGGGWDLDWSQRQWRGFSWNGERFTQSEGERTFPDNQYRLNLTVTATDLVYRAPDDDGTRTGEITVTMTNVGPVTAPRPRLDFALVPDGGAATASPGWYACRERAVNGQHLYCTLSPLAPGEKRKLTFHIVTTGQPPTDATVGLRSLDGNGRVAPDFSEWDNEVKITIR